MERFEDLKIGYSLIVGIVKGTSKKTNLPYEMYHVVNKANDGTLNVGTVFNNSVGLFDVSVGDKVAFLYSGSGYIKNLIEVKQQED